MFMTAGNWKSHSFQMRQHQRQSILEAFVNFDFMNSIFRFPSPKSVLHITKNIPLSSPH